MKYILAILILTGCYTAKKADKQINRALDEYPDKVAEIARNAFPCTTVDSIVTYRDSVIYVECPPVDSVEIYVPVAGPEKIVKVAGPTKTIKVPVTLPVRTVTRIVEDSAKIRLANHAMDLAVKDKDDAMIKAERRGKWNLYLLLALLISWAFFFVNRKFRLI